MEDAKITSSETDSEDLIIKYLNATGEIFSLMLTMKANVSTEKPQDSFTLAFTLPNGIYTADTNKIQNYILEKVLDAVNKETLFNVANIFKRVIDELDKIEVEVIYLNG